MNQEQLKRLSDDAGFVAALDQSGGSTPKALRLYGIEEDQYSNDEEMFGLIHEMRCRIMTDKAFNGDRILAAILFEKTMNDSVEGKPTPQYLWEEKKVVPFLKVDLGLEAEEDGVCLMKAMPGLDARLQDAAAKGIVGTKMRSVINKASASGIKAVVDQQFEVAATIINNGLIPIVEPEVTISNEDKAECEAILKAEILAHLDALPEGQQVMLKLTLPEEANFYSDLIAHKAVTRVVALSGGYSREESCDRLSNNNGMIASFSRALTEGLNAGQSAEDYTATLDGTIEAICQASNT